MPRAFGTTNAAPYAVAPAVGAAGDTYFNTASKTLWLSDGIQWVQVQSGTTAPTYGARAWRNVDQAFTATTATLVFTQTIEDVNLGQPYWNGAGGLTVPPGLGGRYVLAAHCRWEGSGVANSAFIIFVNGAPVVRDAPGQPSTIFFEQHCACVWTLAAGDVVTVGANQNSGVSKNISAVMAAGTDPRGPVLEIYRIEGLQGPKGDPGLDGAPGTAANVGGFLYAQATPGTGINVPTAGMSNTAWTAIQASGWTATGGTVVTCTTPGRYRVHAMLSASTTSPVSGYLLTELRHYNAQATLIAARQTVNNGPGVANAWANFECEAVFNVVAGDYIQCYIQAQGAGVTTDGGASPRSWLTILPVGGAKGDIGPPGTPTSDGFRRRYSGGNFTIPQNATTALTFDLLVDSAGTDYPYNSTTKEITIPADGLYHLFAGVQGENQSWIATQVYLSIQINGVDVSLQYPSGSTYDRPECETIQMLRAGDLVKVNFYQNAAANITIRSAAGGAGAPQSPTLSIWRVGVGLQGPKGDTGTPGLPGNATNAADHWFGQNPANNLGVLGTDVATYVSWSQTIQALGFTLTDSGRRITAATAGRYQVVALLSYNTGGTPSNYSRAILNHYNSAGVAQVGQVSGLGGYAAASAYAQCAVDGVFTMAAGDYITVQGAIANATGIFNGTWATVTPVGGAKGDPGAPLPAGGIPPFQVLTKTGAADQVVGWVTPQYLMARPPTWRIPVLLNSWTNYGAPYMAAGYARKNGVLYLRGLLNRAAVGSVGATIFGLASGYAAHGANNLYNDLFWVAAGGGNQLARVEIVNNAFYGANVVSSDQLGSGGTAAGWLSLANIAIPIDVMVGIEQGFDYVVNGDNTVTVTAGVMWWAGVRYEVPGITLPNTMSGSGTMRVLFVGMNPGGSMTVGQWKDTSEAFALINAGGNGWGRLNMIASGGLTGALTPRYEWV